MTQADLFETVVPRETIYVPPLHEIARAEARRGMTQALEHAEADCPKWGDVALAFLTQFARTHKTFTSFDLREAARNWGLVMPPTDKAFGAIFQRAAKAGIIRKSGYVSHPERHASPTVLWESAP